ncbi:hypothetical protein BCR33DRAFT_856553 [Rhizoclosmatium globosum]|uniref:P/Homo B domain-containing protein n=1 Tax=Rhizoclosmatium globosum TaxID=329046 RepID=A0A1Y2BCC0_9FUNG|nr:hypothetical protein BCR33DRAFT_856553 [Rhizoclosmatium globosum]|eukprot:ORY32478.1 hypothetical protein BCR33DRAFT_856553 [Rhizoclosmatium globosum]
MSPFTALPLLLLLTPHLTTSTPTPAKIAPNNHAEYTYIAIRSSSPLSVATSFNATYIGPIGELPSHHQLAIPHQDLSRRSADPIHPHHYLKRALETHPDVDWVEIQEPKRRYSKRGEDGSMGLKALGGRFGIVDPEFEAQWHILNDGAGQVGHDHNVSGAWDQGVFGKGSTVCIVDDGIYYKSTDLAANYFAEGSYDFNTHSPDAGPKDSLDRHGTRCAGEIAAVKNSVCGVGIAYEAKVSATRILFHDNHIFSCSWGPTDDGRTMEAPSTLVAEAFVNGVTNGRKGLGSVFVFASGNGGASGDDCNFDGFTNSIYTITVSSVDRYDQHPMYSEQCSANMIVMYSSADTRHNDAIATTDWSLGLTGDLCTRSHGGTSAAAPLASGVFALVNSVRPDLGWRDYQHLSVQSAVVVNRNHSSWVKNGAGRLYSHAFGYGKLDAGRIVELAKKWKKVTNQTFIETGVKKITGRDGVIPQGEGKDLKIKFLVKEDDKKVNGFGGLEHVTVTVNITHQRRGDVWVDLVSPSGSVSHLAVGRKYDSDAGGFPGWTFMTVAHWDEEVNGEWTVVVSDRDHPETTGAVQAVSIKFWGSKKDVVRIKTTASSSAGVSAGAVASSNAKISATVSVPVQAGNETVPPTNNSPRLDVGAWVGGMIGLLAGVGVLVWCLVLRKKNEGSKKKQVIVDVEGRLFQRLDDGAGYDDDYEMEE